jgi:DNA modification methylase
MDNVFANRIVGYTTKHASQLTANPANWRKHPQRQRDAVQASLRELGWIAAVVENVRTGYLVDGHERVWQSLKDDLEVPVLQVDLSEDEERLALATFDPITYMAETDAAALDALLKDVNTGETALQELMADLAKDAGLYQDKSDVDAEPQIDRAEELRVKWDVHDGDLWQLGDHRLICGDCTDAAVVARVMGGEKAQMIFTDPPYGVDYDGGAKKRERLSGDEVGTDIYSKALPILAQAADDAASLYLWYADGHAAAAAAAAAAYQITAQIIWAKNHAQFVTSAHYKGKHEACYYAHKKGKMARWYGPNNEVTLWEYDRSSVNEFHPTQKPVELAVRATKNSTTAGDIVLDGFLGSGTTIIACEQLGRRCRAVEISPGYVAVALQRFFDATGVLPVRI